MTNYVIRRLMFGAILIFLSTIVSFTILKLSPGEEGIEDVDPRSSREYIEQWRKMHRLNDHPVRQYLTWLGVTKLMGGSDPGLLQGYLGESSHFSQPVARLIKSRMGATLSLNLIAFFFTWLIAIPAGVYAALYQYKLPDKISSVVSFVGMSLPGFFLGLLLLLWMAGIHHWVPAGGLRDIDHDKMSGWGQFIDYARHMIVPVIVLTFGALAGLQRISRGNMLETLRLQYVTTARAKGLSENKVIYKHALRNALNPLITMLGFEFAALFAGGALLENVLNFPGMGQLILEALRAKDRDVVMASFLMGSFLLVIGNLIAEILLAWVDPRVSYD